MRIGALRNAIERASGRTVLLVLLAALTLTVPGAAFAQATDQPESLDLGDDDDAPSDGIGHEHMGSLYQFRGSPFAVDRMTDLFFTRPLGFALATFTTVTYAIPAAPINAIANPGTNRELAQNMLVDPWRWVFARPLGAAPDHLDPQDD